MSILEEVVVTKLEAARPGGIEQRGGELVATMLLGRNTWWFDDRDELISLIVSGQRLLRDWDEAKHRRATGQPAPAPGSGPVGRPYLPAGPPQLVPRPEQQTVRVARDAALPARGAHAAPLVPAGFTAPLGEVVPDPPQAAAAP